MPDPDPLDGRDDVMDQRPFTLPCTCGAAALNERLVRQLAIAHGRSIEAERVAWGVDRAHGAAVQGSTA